MTRLFLALLLITSLPLRAAQAPRELADKLVALQASKLQSADTTRLRRARVVAFFYSAAWCAPCRQFSPKLVRFYNAALKQYPWFEVVLVSHDRNDHELIEHLNAEQISFPVLRMEQAPGWVQLRCGKGIPTLVITDAEGRVLSQSWQEDRQRPPEVILGDLNLFLQKRS
jgi:nucleoredoxin